MHLKVLSIPNDNSGKIIFSDDRNAHLACSQGEYMLL